jgi:NAD(P)-dependent dehydrogenase (short-subunit alcohol dehydrogenase family)
MITGATSGFGAATVRRFGRVDVLVNAAGVYPRRPVFDISAEDWRFVFEVNVLGTYFMMVEAIADMRTRGAGHIVNISSVASIDAFPVFVAYGASKAWVNAWTKGLAEEGRTLGIRVFAIAPGGVETQMLPEFSKAHAPKECVMIPRNYKIPIPT